MIRTVSAVFLLLTTSAVMAEEARQLDAHEHGVGQLDIAFEQGKIAMVLHAPGADIVGFEYAAQSSEDRAKVDAAVATLARPLDLFSLPASAGCSVVEASASLESEAAQDDHDQAAHKDEGHAHDHAEADHKEEDQSHAKEHGHEDHAEQAGHTEFHAEYLLECADPTQATLITFGYFEAFANARELEVQVISERGASAFEVERDAPTLDLRSLF